MYKFVFREFRCLPTANIQILCWPWQWGQSHQNLINSLLIYASLTIIHSSVHEIVCTQSVFDQNLMVVGVLWPWKWCQVHQNLAIRFLKVWRESTHRFRRHCTDKKVPCWLWCQRHTKPIYVPLQGVWGGGWARVYVKHCRMSDKCKSLQCILWPFFISAQPTMYIFIEKYIMRTAETYHGIIIKALLIYNSFLIFF